MGQGLPARQRRVLERTECALRGSDPKLAALYSVFSRLTRDEEMPAIEQLRTSAMHAFAKLRPASHVRSSGRPPVRWRAVFFFPIALALAVTAIVFAVRSNPSGCAPVRSVAATKHIAKEKLCGPGMLTPITGR